VGNKIFLPHDGGHYGSAIFRTVRIISITLCTRLAVGPIIICRAVTTQNRGLPNSVSILMDTTHSYRNAFKGSFLSSVDATTGVFFTCRYCCCCCCCSFLLSSPLVVAGRATEHSSPSTALTPPRKSITTTIVSRCWWCRSFIVVLCYFCSSSTTTTTATTSISTANILTRSSTSSSRSSRSGDTIVHEIIHFVVSCASAGAITTQLF